MSNRIALCLDENACSHPELVGLDGENLESQAWLEIYSEGATAREAIGGDSGIEEAWVVSCGEVEPINLAAALKADRPDLQVRLVTFEGCGSLYSRAHTALIDEVLEGSAFLKRYAEAKQRAVGEPAPVQEDASASVVTPAPVVAATTLAPAEDAVAPALVSTPTSTPASALAVEAASDSDPGDAAASASALAVPTSALAASASALTTPAPSPAVETAPASDDVATSPGLFAKVAERTPGHARDVQASPSSLVVPLSKRGFVMPVVSGSGGAGKSTVSVVAAHVARRAGYRTLLLDFDLQFGDVAAMAGVENPLAIDVALAHPDQFERECKRDDSLVVLSAPARLEAGESLVAELPEFIDALSLRFDVIVANTGAAWAEQHAVILERSSAALFLVDQRMSSVRACRHALELCARCGIASGPFQFALNRCAKGAPLSSVDVSCALQGVPVFEFKDGGRDVEDCLSGGAIAELFDSGNEFVGSVERVMGYLLPQLAAKSGHEQETGKKPPRRRGRHAGKRRGRKAL